MTIFFEAVLNGWWQGILLTLLVWVVLRDLPRISAATRLAIWQLTLLIVLLLPVLQGVLLPFWNDRTSGLPAKDRQTELAPTPATVALAELKPLPAMPPRPLVEVSESSVAPMLLAGALLLALVQLLRLAIGYWVVRRLKKSARPSEIRLPQTGSRKTRIMVSDRIGMPMAVGYLQPVILLPRDMVQGLKDEEMQHVLLHESAHLERKDDWIGLVERLVRAIFAFQPAVYFIGRQITREREMACDNWVVAQLGQTKPYAQALTRVAELGSSQSIPLLATGAGRRKEIFSRLEALLDGTRNKIPSASEPLVMLVGLLLLLAVTQAAPFSYLFGFSNYNSRSINSSSEGRREFKTRGEIRFEVNDADVETMSPGAKLVLEQSDRWNSRTVEIESDLDGNIERRFFVGAIRQSYGSEAKRFLSKELRQWLRESGTNLPERLARWVERDGVDGALREIRGIRSSEVKRRYLEELLVGNKLTDDQLHRVLRLAGEINSDSEKRQFLEKVDTKLLDQGLDTQLFDFVDTLHSGSDRKELLGGLMGAVKASSQPRLFRSIGLIQSDAEKTELLIQAAERLGRQLSAAYFEAVGTIHSDGDRKRILLSVLERHGSELEAVRQVTRSLDSVHSDGDKAHCLLTLLEAPGGNAETLRDILLQAAKLHSDGDKSQVLVKATEAPLDQDPVRKAFFDATQTIHSSGDQRKVLVALLDRPQLTSETIVSAARIAAQMHSHGDRDAVMQSISRR